jgi:hypothetical protein
MLGKMSVKAWAGLGAGLLTGGSGLFLAGAFFLTHNARHADISQAVYWGVGIALLGLVLLLVAGLGALLKRP